MLFVLLVSCAPTPNNDRDTQGNTPAATPEPENQVDETYTKGTLTDTSFESRFLNLRFDLPDGFIMATEEDMAELMNIGAETFGIESEAVDYALISTVYEMMATAPLGAPNVILIAEKLVFRNMTEEQYLNALKAQLSEVPGVDYTFPGDTESVVIAGETYSKLVTELSAHGQTMYQDYIFRRLGDRMIGFIVTFTAETREDMKALMSNFRTY